MRFLLRNSFSALGDPYIIKDHESKAAYQLRGRFHTPHSRHIFSTLTGMELAHLLQKEVGTQGRVLILMGGRSNGAVVRSESWMGKRISMDMAPEGYTLNGDLWGREYSMFSEDRLVATVSKRIFNVPGAYGLEVTSWDHTVQALCTAMAVDLAAYPERGE